ncbi:MAG: methyltransferase [Phycisphaerae bacterium]|nr:methyltransferase [Phycisphaerae bacterium]
MDVRKLKRDIVFRQRLRGMDFAFHSTWGLFSPRGVDEGSRLLIEQLEVGPEDICLDLGCGYGPIGMAMGRLANKGKVYLVDRDFVAVEYAGKNVKVNRLSNCQVRLGNGFEGLATGKFNVVAANLPAKVGKELLYILLSDAKRRLVSGGALYLVSVSGLRAFIKRACEEIFGNYEKLKQGRHYTVAKAVKSRRKDRHENQGG